MKIDDLSYVALDGSVPIYVECGDASAAEWAKRHFSQWFGTDAGVARSQYTGPDADGEAYRLSVGKHGVVLSARTLAGIRHAAHSLRQIAIPVRGTLKVSHYIDRKARDARLRAGVPAAVRASHGLELVPVQSRGAACAVGTCRGDARGVRIAAVFSSRLRRG
ncbi:MAG: hypothetical protein IJQ65_07460 [Kiritimatiellae bacterium]|nr:hypothetical protein [Kiritimatiellia bacterium]